MLPLTLSREDIELLLKDVSSGEPAELTIDLPNQKVIRPNGEEISFEIDEFRKFCLVNGLDKIGLTLEKDGLISKFESERSEKFPWLDGAAMKVPDSVPMYPSADFWNKQVA
mmetsp:Transcript_12069/g.17159  ORF Transcript_12069/g.17159 Transcript_12069/m.17159 type:complete len:112 (+) Transcript_12069:1077-1412(+)